MVGLMVEEVRDRQVILEMERPVSNGKDTDGRGRLRCPQGRSRKLCCKVAVIFLARYAL
jgi:hypothetical protein